MGVSHRTRGTLGTLQVRQYLLDIESYTRPEWEVPTLAIDYDTVGPANRYLNVLFIEKEGFMPLFRAVRLAERYDLAIMSTKGLSTTAARRLLEEDPRGPFLDIA